MEKKIYHLIFVDSLQFESYMDLSGRKIRENTISAENLIHVFRCFSSRVSRPAGVSISYRVNLNRKSVIKDKKKRWDTIFTEDSHEILQGKPSKNTQKCKENLSLFHNNSVNINKLA